MADELAPPDERILVLTGIVEHWCEEPGCERWGCFGEPRGKETHWFCGDDRDRD